MNFKRLLNSGIELCVGHDLRFWVGNQVIRDDKDYGETVAVIIAEFRILGELHHTISAQLDTFPTFKLLHL